MKKEFLVLGMMLSVQAFAEVAPLPNWIDPSREVIQTFEREQTRGNNPPPPSFRLPAEYEVSKAVVLGWRGYAPMLKEIAKAVTNYGNAEIWAMGGPATIAGADADKYQTYNCPLDTVWVRDYGPFGVDENGHALGIVDTVYRHWQYRRNDDRAPECLATKKNVENFKMDLILDGGNLMVDSKGNLFTTTRTYLWNKDKTPEQVRSMLKEYFNAKEVHVIEYAGHPGQPADGTGHIDMFVKLLNDSTVLIAQAEQEPFKSAAEKAVKYFQSMKSASGEDYKIIRVKGWSNYNTWYTYTNSLIVNNMVMIPVYRGAEADNAKAIAAYEEGMPGVKVVPIFSDDSIVAGGSIHCVTQLIPGVL